MKSVVAAFNQEKALVVAFSVIMNLRMELFQALCSTPPPILRTRGYLGSIKHCYYNKDNTDNNMTETENNGHIFKQ